MTCNFRLKNNMSSYLTILLFSLVAVVHYSACNELISKTTAPVDSTRLGVYDGTNTTIKDHPFLAVLTENGIYLCQTIIVSEHWTLTPGACVVSYPIESYRIIAGSEDAKKGTTYAVTNVVLHPKYVVGSLDFDYGCVMIDGNFKWSDKVQPIKLPSQQPKVNTNMVVAGWGSTSYIESDDEPSYTLLQGNMKWLAKAKCKHTYEPLGVTWTNRMACAYNKGNTTLCTGDWGDAFVSDGVVYGIFIAGVTAGWCSSEAKPVLLADITPVSDWIRKITGARIKDD